MLLTIIIPVYNEAATVDEVLRRVLAGPYRFPESEIVVVDDGSADGTSQRLVAWQHQPGVAIVRHSTNLGKGSAIRTALTRVHGAITIIQDADLEYDPADMPSLIEPIRQGRADAVFGSRYLAVDGHVGHPRSGVNGRHAPPWSKFRVAVAMLNSLVRLLYGVRLTDEATCYKAIRADLLRSLDLQARRFEFCPEVTAKLCRLAVPILEVPISYRPRTVREGKKIRWRDAWEAVATLVAWRFRPFTALGETNVPLRFSATSGKSRPER